MNKIILASSSPRRQEIAQNLGLDFVVQPVDVEERPLPGEAPREAAERLALAKASAAGTARRSGVVVGADTVVAVDGQILGKPSSQAEARRMLRRLRNRPHLVITGVAVVDAQENRRHVSSATTRVWMRNYSDAEIDDYVRSGEPMDKAGAYAIQSTRTRLVDRIEGCYLNVVGLPACELVEGLEAVGYPIARATWEKLALLCRGCPQVVGKQIIPQEDSAEG